MKRIVEVGADGAARVGVRQRVAGAAFLHEQLLAVDEIRRRMLDGAPSESDERDSAHQQSREAPGLAWNGSDHTLGAALYPSSRHPGAVACGVQKRPRPGPLVALRRNEDAPEVPDADALHRSRSDHRSSAWTGVYRPRHGRG